MANPYETPQVDAKLAKANRIGFVILSGLLFCFLATIALAAINTHEEGYPVFWSGLLLILLAVVSQVPGMIFAVWYWKTRSAIAIPFLIGALIIGATGVAAFAKYAFDGKAESIESSAHMHVVAFPVVHCVLGSVVYLLGGIIAAVIAVIRKKQRQDGLTAPN